MKICIDGFPLRFPASGIGTYTRQMLRHFLRLGHGHQFYLTDLGMPLLHGPAGPLSDGEDPDAAVARFTARIPALWKRAPFVLRKPFLRRDIRAVGADLYFATNFLGLFGDRFKTVLTIHDLGHKRFPEATDPSMLRHLSRSLAHDAQRAHAIFADSQFTRQEIIELLNVPGDKIHVVYCGVDPSFRPVDDRAALESARRRHGLPERFLLFVGTVEPRKNLVTLLAAFAELAADPSFRHSLVIVGGKGWKDQAIREALADNRLAGRVVTTGFVPAPDLPLIYNLAEALVLPSLYEGFGIPVLEAMACGTPVVTSNVSSLPEVAGDAAVLVDPRRPGDIAEGIRRVVDDGSLRDDLRRRGLVRLQAFSWDKSAHQALDVFERLMGATS